MNGFGSLSARMSRSYIRTAQRQVSPPSSFADIAAVGSDYFSFCFPLHISRESDLVLVELGVNDEAIPEHVENMENLLRGLLEMDRQPAVMLVEALAFSNGGMGGGGGRMHLPVAQFYGEPCRPPR